MVEWNLRIWNTFEGFWIYSYLTVFFYFQSVADVGEIKQSYDAAKHELEAEQAHARELELLVQKSRHKEFEIQLDAAQLKVSF